jgi:hypothetical protein
MNRFTTRLPRSRFSQKFRGIALGIITYLITACQPDVPGIDINLSKICYFNINFKPLDNGIAYFLGILPTHEF